MNLLKRKIYGISLFQVLTRDFFSCHFLLLTHKCPRSQEVVVNVTQLYLLNIRGKYTFFSGFSFLYFCIVLHHVDQTDQNGLMNFKIWTLKWLEP